MFPFFGSSIKIAMTCKKKSMEGMDFKTSSVSVTYNKATNANPPAIRALIIDSAHENEYPSILE
ncbi:FHA domain protein, putative [Paenibacillus sp. NAIST15-1]|nr:FHA domain protein, putative [Paenibacillus sp. NAIST15-1]